MPHVVGCGAYVVGNVRFLYRRPVRGATDLRSKGTPSREAALEELAVSQLRSAAHELLHWPSRGVHLLASSGLRPRCHRAPVDVHQGSPQSDAAPRAQCCPSAPEARTHWLAPTRELRHCGAHAASTSSLSRNETRK